LVEAADELPGLDTRVWVADDEFDAMLADLPSLAPTVGLPPDILFETPGSHYSFVQYLDGVQLELLALRASEANGRVNGELVLIDRDGLLEDVDDPSLPWDRNLWLGWAWMRLFDLDKYLRRGVLWKALIKLVGGSVAGRERRRSHERNCGRGRAVRGDEDAPACTTRSGGSQRSLIRTIKRRRIRQRLPRLPLGRGC
jgi:hypothetical protein